MLIFYLIAFSTGLVSSLHCVGMCGPLALALPVGKFSKNKAFLSKILYNLGRITTYSLLGLVFGFIGKTVFIFNLQQKLSIFLGLALIIISFRNQITFPKFISTFKAKTLKYFTPKSLFTFFVLGIFNGLLPCAMIYLALSGAVVSAKPINGMIYMVFFGLGTAPAMFFISYFAEILRNRNSIFLRKYTSTFTAIIAVFLIIRGLNLGIPYLSPAVSETPQKQAITICHGR